MERRYGVNGDWYVLLSYKIIINIDIRLQNILRIQIL